VCRACVPKLEEALALYRDDFLAGFTLRDSLAFDEWQFFQTEGLRGELASALERLVGWAGAQEDLDAAISHARRWLALDPLHEPAHRRLMELYAQSGQQAAALRQYALLHESLAKELGVPPAAESVALAERIRSGEVQRTGALPPGAAHNLPVQNTPFVGREGELAELEELIADPDVRLITLLGPGGIGKTRLALAAAQAQLERASTSSTSAQARRFADGVVFVPLAPLSAAAHILPTLAGALSFRTDSGPRKPRTPREQILDFLARKRILLVFDNLDHLLVGAGADTCRQLLAEILQRAPELQILTTSRQRLNLQQEQVYTVAGLTYPGRGIAFSKDSLNSEGMDEAQDILSPSKDILSPSKDAALQLFVQSARRVRPDFELGPEDTNALAHICRLVEGMPLGIELAASWVDVLPVTAIAEEVHRSLDFLETEWKDVPRRHRSVRAVFDGSWEQLTQEEQDVFARLSVFRGGFTREAARQVAGAGLGTLARLTHKSLLGYDRSRDRYQIHELLRQYGAEKLAASSDDADVRARHSAYFCTALGHWEQELKSARQIEVVSEIEADYENVRLAWKRAEDGRELQKLAQATNGLGEFYMARLGWSEGEVILNEAIERLRGPAGGVPAEPDTARFLPLLMAWRFALRWDPENTMYHEDDLSSLRQGLAMLDASAVAGADTSADQAFIRYQLGRLLIYAGSKESVQEGRQHLEASLGLYCAEGDDVGRSDVLFELAHCAVNDKAFELAQSLLDESLTVLRETGEPRRTARSLVALGDVSRELKTYDAAQEMYEQAYATSRAAGQPLGMVHARVRAGHLASFLGEFDTALGYYRDASALARQGGSPHDVAFYLALVAQVQVYRGRFSQAVELNREANAIDAQRNLKVGPIQLVMAQMHSGRYGAARELAREMVEKQEHELDEPAARRFLGWIALAEERHGEALRACRRSLELTQNLFYPSLRREWQAWTHAPLGLALHGLGRQAEAREDLYEALGTCVEMRAFLPLMHLVPVISVLLAGEQDPHLKERAVELFALTERLPYIANSVLLEQVAGRHIKAATATLPPEVQAAARGRGRASDWWETAEALMSELDGSRRAF
jgi:predicted ATPase/rubrerythrin